MKEIQVGLIGCGYWGPNLIRNFNENDHTDIGYACDLDAKSLKKITIYPQLPSKTSVSILLRSFATR